MDLKKIQRRLGVGGPLKPSESIGRVQARDSERQSRNDDDEFNVVQRDRDADAQRDRGDDGPTREAARQSGDGAGPSEEEQFSDPRSRQSILQGRDQRRRDPDRRRCLFPSPTAPSAPTDRGRPGAPSVASQSRRLRVPRRQAHNGPCGGDTRSRGVAWCRHG